MIRKLICIQLSSCEMQSLQYFKRQLQQKTATICHLPRNLVMHHFRSSARANSVNGGGCTSFFGAITKLHTSRPFKSNAPCMRLKLQYLCTQEHGPKEPY